MGKENKADEGPEALGALFIIVARLNLYTKSYDCEGGRGGRIARAITRWRCTAREPVFTMLVVATSMASCSCARCSVPFGIYVASFALDLGARSSQVLAEHGGIQMKTRAVARCGAAGVLTHEIGRSSASTSPRRTRPASLFCTNIVLSVSKKRD